MVCFTATIAALALALPIHSILPPLGPGVVAPSTVFVDDDFSPATPGWNVDHFQDIRRGVGAVAEFGVVLVSPGNYQFPVAVTRKMTIEATEPHTAVLDVNGEPYGFSLQGNGIVLRNLVVQGASEQAIEVFGRFCTIEGVVARDSAKGMQTEEEALGTLISGCEVYDNSRGITITSDNTVVEHSSFEGANNYDIAVGVVSGCEIRDNVIASSEASGIEGSSYPNYSDIDLLVTGNTFSSNQNNISLLFLGGLRIENNVFLSQPYWNISLREAHDSVLVGNQFTYTTSFGIKLTSSDRVEVRGNVFDGTALDGLVVNWSKDVLVIDNDFKRGGLSVLGTIEDAASMTVTGNIVGAAPILYYASEPGPIVTPLGAGQVIARDCADLTVVGVNATSGASAAIHVIDSPGAKIVRNSVDGGRDGIRVENSPGSTVGQNAVTGCEASGVRMEDSPNGVVEGNLITANELGMNLIGSAPTLITDNVINTNYDTLRQGSFKGCGASPNTFLRNAFWGNMALIDDCGAIWNDGSSGNYHLDYTGVDADADGIGDTPHVIAGGMATDGLPLVVPFGGGVAWADRYGFSAATGGVNQLKLAIDPIHAGRPYLVVSGISGTSPGVTLSTGVNLPVNFDFFSSFVVKNVAFFPGFLGSVGGDGRAFCNVPAPPLDPIFVGFEFVYAFVLPDALDITSNAVRFRIGH